MSDRIGDWFVTYTGRQFYPFDARVEDINIEDIAHSLSMQTRWMGHCKAFYSIASHSLACARIAEKELASPEIVAWALMHDAAEAYVGDIIRPIKGYLAVVTPSSFSAPSALTPIKFIEDKLLQCIAERFLLPWPMPPDILVIDNRMLITEAQANTNYMSHEHWVHQKPWRHIKPYANPDVLLWQTSEVAEQAFLARAKEYLDL